MVAAKRSREERKERKKKKEGEKKREIVITLGSCGVGNEHGNPPVMGTRNIALCSFVFYSLNLRPQSRLLKTYMGSF